MCLKIFGVRRTPYAAAAGDKICGPRGGKRREIETNGTPFYNEQEEEDKVRLPTHTLPPSHLFFCFSLSPLFRASALFRILLFFPAKKTKEKGTFFGLFCVRSARIQKGFSSLSFLSAAKPSDLDTLGVGVVLLFSVITMCVFS